MALLIWTENLHGWAALSEWLPENPWPFVLLGVAVGMMVGLTSIGAGAIATPVLIMFLDVPPIGAVGSAIVAGAAMKAVGIWRHQQRGTVDRKLVGYLLTGSVPGVLVAVLIVSFLRSQDFSLANVWVDRVLGFTLLVLGLCVLARNTEWVRRWQAGMDHPNVARRGLMIGALVGLLFGTTSIGTGSLLVLLLTIFLALPEVRVVGSAILYGFVISLFAGVIHVALGNMIWGLVMLLLAGALPGVLLGSELAVRAPHRLLRTAFSVGAVLAGLKLI